VAIPETYFNDRNFKSKDRTIYCFLPQRAKSAKLIFIFFLMACDYCRYFGRLLMFCSRLNKFSVGDAKLCSLDIIDKLTFNLLLRNAPLNEFNFNQRCHVC